MAITKSPKTRFRCIGFFAGKTRLRDTFFRLSDPWLDSLPFLPAQRPRPLTPAVSEQSPATLGTLARLPPELRRRTLTAAFGSRTLHLDMQFAPPRRASACDRLTPDFDASTAPVHGFGVSPFVGTATRQTKGKMTASRVSITSHMVHVPTPLSPYYFPADDAPRAWRWTNCVCHRMFPPGSRWERHALARDGYHYPPGPHTDKCLRGEAMYCFLWPPEMIAAPGKCKVGAMGWLLACRQAYLEGIEVLYSTNMYSIESDVLFSHLVI
ncbi:hypothetical protein N657DRAFT_637897 [Parathielavia appendiculata]|uniref:Uncharacterized protein n=1 Tax=Parathielavia appendiculata TaxID=2587402 RepID=A0AAN6TQW7_9PEZI|nr:hypothetical protein N657DRAFT_637897 [Parathielavia appendiculata]